MTSVQVATKAMAAGEGWDSDGSLSWEDFFGKKMIEHQFHITKTLPDMTLVICVNYMASYVKYNYCHLVSCPNVTVQRSAQCGGTTFVFRGRYVFCRFGNPSCLSRYMKQSTLTSCLVCSTAGPLKTANVWNLI